MLACRRKWQAQLLMVFTRKLHGTMVENNNAKTNERCSGKKCRAKNRRGQRLGISGKILSGQKGPQLQLQQPTSAIDMSLEESTNLLSTKQGMILEGKACLYTTEIFLNKKRSRNSPETALYASPSWEIIVSNRKCADIVMSQR